MSEESLMELVSGVLPPDEAQRLLKDVERCPKCVILLAEAGQGMWEAPSAPAGGLVLEPGELLLERYRIERCLGRGGMGEVYEAEDLATRSKVALKTIRAELSDVPNAIGRFRQEIHIARQITHPNICRIFDFGTDVSNKREIHFLTMEYLQGRLLTGFLREYGPFELSRALDFVQQLALGLTVIHSLGVVHRDVKPDNVMLCTRPDGVTYPVLLDFGAARSRERFEGLQTTRRGVCIGTPDYMAPEQLMGTRPSVACDIYALGLVLFELLTGRFPFERSSSVKHALERIGKPVPLVSQYRGGVSLVVDAIVRSCLDSEPHLRPSAAALASQLASLSLNA